MEIESLALLIDEQPWDANTKTTMLAIAIAESGLNEHATGDPLSNYKGHWNDTYGPYASGGYLSFGLFQVFTYWHRDKLTRLTGSTNPDAWRAYLMDPLNNLQVAAEILGSTGLHAWSAYNQGTYLQFMPQAERAFTDLRAANVPQTVSGLAEECVTIIRTLRHIADRLESLFVLKPPF